MQIVFWEVVEETPRGQDGQSKVREGRRVVDGMLSIKPVSTVGNWDSVPSEASGRQQRASFSESPHTVGTGLGSHPH